MRALSLVLAFCFCTQTFATSAPKVTDNELWNALVSLELRNQRIGEENFLAVGTLAGLATAFAAGGAAIYFNANRRAVAQTLGYVAGAGAGVYVTGTALFFLQHLVDALLHSPANREYPPITSDVNHPYRQGMSTITPLMKMPLYERFQKVVSEPELRQYVIELDAWLRTNTKKNAPPIRPVAESTQP